MEYLNKALSMLDENAHASATLGLFLVLYAGLAAPKLPKNVAMLFDNSAFKLTIMFLIAYMSSKNSSVAIVATVALVVSMQTLSMYQTNDIIMDAVKNKDLVQKSETLAEMETISEVEGTASDSSVQYSEVKGNASSEEHAEFAENLGSEEQSEDEKQSEVEEKPEVEEFRSKANNQSGVTGYGSSNFANF